MGKPGGKLSQRCQSVALLLQARRFADAIGHQADQPLGEFWHSLNEFGEFRRREAEHSSIGKGAGGHRELFHARKGKYAAYIARFAVEYECLAADFPAC